MNLRNAICLVFSLVLSVGIVFADNTVPIQQNQNVQSNSVTSPQNISYQNCTKIFKLNNEKLYLLTIDAISANKFKIDEMQTSDGYIIFSAAKHKYLATIAKVDETNSMLKITPCNNVYIFPPGVLSNMFKYIELKTNTGI